uniref:Arrestin C-terminal-like domain-containing protein n=1 Tax=Salarias fasciatus TaxID=181472 RepID=A0A672HGZ2_SALFA
MGKLQEFDITFTNNKVVYGPGESISGTVKIRTGNSLQYKAIKVNCQGSCGISNKVNDASWILEEQYFNSTLSVADKGTLGPGEHSFPFQFLIPVAAPTSFEGPFGKIAYRVRAVIDTPRFSKDYKAQKPFYLLNLLNLNEVPDIEHPSHAVTTKKFSYLLVKSGTLMLKARSELRGYIPGQVIKLATEIHNKSGKDTGCVLASLIQKVTYKTKRPVYDLRTIAEVEGAGVKAGKHAEWREQIIVPPLPQSALAGCSLIDIDYFIQVCVYVGAATAISLCNSAVEKQGEIWSKMKNRDILSVKWEYHVLLLSPCAAGVAKVSGRRRHPAHLHRQHRCEPVSLEDRALQPGPLRGGGRDAERPAGRGRAGGGAVRRRPRQRGDPHQEPLPAGPLGSAGHHVPQRLQPRPRRRRAARPPAARRLGAAVLRLHRSHHPVLHRGERDARAHFLFPHPPPRVQQLGLPSRWVEQETLRPHTETHTCNIARELI